MRFRSSGLLGILSLAVTGTTVSAAVIDSFLPDVRPQANGNSFGYMQSQSFVAQTSDSIGSIGLIVDYAADDARVDLFAVAADNTPTGSSLAHGIISSGVAQVPDGDGFDGDPLNDMSTFNLTSPFPVQAGDKYAIVFTSDFNIYIAGAPQDKDIGFSYSQNGGQTFAPFGPIAAAYVINSTPEPASLSLLALGGVTLLRRKRASSNSIH